MSVSLHMAPKTPAPIVWKLMKQPRPRPWIQIAALACALTACIDQPSDWREQKPGSRLIGSWKADLMMDPAVINATKRRGLTPEEVAKQAQGAEGLEAPFVLTFSDAGQFVMEGSMLGHPLREVTTWTVKEETTEQVTIELQEDGREPSAMTYVFVEPNVIRTDMPIGPAFFRRVE